LLALLLSVPNSWGFPELENLESPILNDYLSALTNKADKKNGISAL